MACRFYPRSVVLALFVTVCTLAYAQPEDSSSLPTYRRTVSEVRLTFFATDESGHAVENVSAADFAVVDDEQVIRTFRSFQRSSETALDIVALVDASESVAPRLRRTLASVFEMVAREQSIPEDRISVLSFGGATSPDGRAATLQPAVLCSSGCRQTDALTPLLTARSGGATPLFDALIFACGFAGRNRRAGTRPVLVLFSDGNDTISLHSARETLRAAAADGILVYAVDLNSAATPSAGSQFLRQLAQSSGGRCFAQDSASAVLQSALEDLRASYVVTYNVASRQPGFHLVRLLPTRNLNLTFHSRGGYVFEPDTP